MSAVFGIGQWLLVSMTTVTSCPHVYVQVLDDAPSLLERFPQQISSVLGWRSSDRSYYQVVLTASSCDPVCWPKILALAHNPVCVLTSAIDVLLTNEVALVGVASNSVLHWHVVPTVCMCAYN